MTKPNQAEFKRKEELEKAFEKRYGKKVEVYRAFTKGESGVLEIATIHIITPDGVKYTITEYLKNGEVTDFVLSGKENDERKYNNYLEAEVYVADLIGDK